MWQTVPGIRQSHAFVKKVIDGQPIVKNKYTLNPDEILLNLRNELLKAGNYWPSSGYFLKYILAIKWTIFCGMILAFIIFHILTDFSTWYVPEYERYAINATKYKKNKVPQNKVDKKKKNKGKKDSSSSSSDIELDPAVQAQKNLLNAQIKATNLLIDKLEKEGKDQGGPSDE